MVGGNIALRAQVGPYGGTPTFAGYYETVPRTGMRGYRRGLGDGTPWYAGVLNWAENVAGGLPADAPYAGGGSVTNPDGTISFVNSSGEYSPTSDPLAGTSPSILPAGLTIPSWVWWAGGTALALFLLGYSGVGRGASSVLARANRRRRPVHRRRHRRSRR